MGIEEKTQFAQNLFFYAACVQNSNCFRTDEYIFLVKKKSSLTMPSDISYANSCVNVFFFPNYDVQCVYLCTEAADRNVNMLYICKFEQQDFVRNI